MEYLAKRLSNWLDMSRPGCWKEAQSGTNDENWTLLWGVVMPVQQDLNFISAPPRWNILSMKASLTEELTSFREFGQATRKMVTMFPGLNGRHIKRVGVAELIRKEMRRDGNLPHASVRQLQRAAGD